MQRLSGLDASFLYLETPEQPLHICGLMLLDPSTMPGGYRFDRFRAGLAARIAAVPRFRMKLADSRLNPDHPVWVDDDSFELDRHLHRVAVPAPGTRVELADLCGHLASLPLDRARPLWEMWVLERPTGEVAAVVTKMHHAGVDGVTAAAMVAQLCDLTPDAPPPAPVRDGAGGGNAVEIALTGVVNVALRPWHLLRILPTAVTSATSWISRARRGSAMPAPFTAPRTPFNVTITGRRNVAFTQLEIADIKTVKDAFGVKVNDVVMCLVAGALRRHLARHGALPDTSLVSIVPVSVHGRSDRPGRNQVSAMFAKLRTDIADPAARLEALRETNTVAKEHNSAIGASLLQDWSQLGAAGLFETAMRTYAALHLAEKHPAIHNLVISNVPGPAVGLYFLGARITGMYPFGPIFHGAALNVTVLSLDGKLDVGLISCPDAVPELWELADDFAPALDELLAAARRPRPGVGRHDDGAEPAHD